MLHYDKFKFTLKFLFLLYKPIIHNNMNKLLCPSNNVNVILFILYYTPVKNKIKICIVNLN